MNSTVPDGHELEQLRDVVGPEVSRRRLRDLLERAGGSVQRAVDLHFSAADSGNDVPEQVTLDLVAGPSTGPAQGNSSPRPTRRAVMGLVASHRHLADFVELSSSTDNDFDPDAPDESNDNISVEDSESEDNSPGQRLHDVKDWGALDFNIIRNAALRKGLPSIRRNKLPLAKYRPITGRLSCSNVAAVPDKTVLDLKYPIHLGTLRMPLSEAKAGCNAAAARPADCSCSFVVKHLLPGPSEVPWSPFRSGLALSGFSGYTAMKICIQGMKDVHVATVGGDPANHTSLGKLCSHLAELAEADHIRLTARLVPGPAHPEMIKAAALPDSHKIQKPLHAEVDILLTEKAVLTNGRDIDELAEVKKAKGRGKKDNTAQSWAKNARDIAPVLNWLMLADTAGLQIGPDCDGLLNFCDQADSGIAASAALKQDGAEGSEGTQADKAEQGPSEGTANGQQQASEGQPGHASGGKIRKAAPMTVQQMLDSVALPDDAAVAVAPRCLRTVPKQFQLQGLHWMLARERQGDALGRGQLHLHPEWLQFITPDKQLLHFHRLANLFSDTLFSAPVGGTCGGFLCDEMGLGKTLQSLMLILSNPPPASWPVHKLEKQEHDKGEAVPIQTTLIVMPANLLQQWQDELGKHVQDGALKWCVYDGKADYLAVAQQQQNQGKKKTGAGGAALPDPERAQTRRTRSQRDLAAESGFVNLVRPIWCLNPAGDPVQMHQQDIALMTYEQLRKELGASDKCPLLQFGFWRVMLDEAQLVAATSSVAAQMTSSLWRRHAWVVTGTPITTRLDEIQGLLEFLAYEPFYHSNVWRALLQKPLLGSHPDAKTPLRSLMQGVLLRRTRAHVGDQLSLPPCQHIDKWVSLSSVERSFYDRLHKQVISTQVQHQASQKSRRNATSNTRSNPASIAGRLVRKFTELRQSCCHPQIVRTCDSMLGGKGGGRLSMQDIMARLTAKAYMEYDQAARGHATARLLQEALAVPPKHRPSGAYLEVMQQIMAAVQSASQLDVAQLIQDRTADGSLPPVLTTDASQHNDAAAAAAAAAVPGLAKRKALDTEQDGVQEAEGLQMRNAKRPRVEAGEGEQPQEAQKGQAGSGAAATQGLSAPKRGNGTSVTPIAAAAAGVASDQGLSTDGIALPDQATSTGPGPAGLDTAGNPPTKTGRRYLGSSSAAALDRLEQSHGRVSKQAGSGAALMASQPHEGNPEGSARAPPRDGAAGTSGGPSREQTSTALVDQHARGQPGASIAMPGEGSLQSTHPGPSSRDQPGPSSRDQPGPSTQDQAGPSSQDQPGPRATQIHPGASGGLPDQDMGEEADPEVKEKREQARNRIRYWRKVLLDGLDLQAELTAAAAAAGLPDSEVAEAEAKVLEEESAQLRAELGLDPAPGPLSEEAPRFSKRARQMAPETELESDAAVSLQEAHAAHLRAAKVILKTYDDLKARRGGAAAAAASSASSSHEALRKKWRTVQHMYHKQMEVTADAKGKSIAALPGGAAQPSQLAEVVEQGDTNTCPICLDECAARTVTACGHYFCSACIHELVEGGQSGGVPCPLCRSQLHSGDLYDAVSEEEAAEARQAASIQGDYGSKVSTLLLELAAMKAADPTAKAVVFSSWSRLLRLVEEALQDNNIAYTSIAGAQADSRVDALRRFMKDPDCTVLTVVMSTGGGAAGLTLTVASHVFLLEPNLNPGLEAQAAARVYRLGQTKPTRVIRLLTEGTIEKSILTYQRNKLQTSGQAQTGIHLQEAELLAGNTLADLLAAHP